MSTSRARPVTVVPADYHHGPIRLKHYGRIVLACIASIQLHSGGLFLPLRLEIAHAFAQRYCFLFTYHPRRIVNMAPGWFSQAQNFILQAIKDVFEHVHPVPDFLEHPRYKLVLYALSRSSIRAELCALLRDRVHIEFTHSVRANSESWRDRFQPDYQENVLADCWMAFITCISEHSPDRARFFLVRFLSPFIHHMYSANLDVSLTPEGLARRALALHRDGLGSQDHALHGHPAQVQTA
ncbi:hypothetical protein ONZ45_g6277 [Pleurotus djamor]|nr:hypothetical protein ONZ45_g6277 [Pleurotus djamor]